MWMAAEKKGAAWDEGRLLTWMPVTGWITGHWADKASPSRQGLLNGINCKRNLKDNKWIRPLGASNTLGLDERVRILEEAGSDLDYESYFILQSNPFFSRWENSDLETVISPTVSGQPGQACWILAQPSLSDSSVRNAGMRMSHRWKCWGRPRADDSEMWLR